MKNSILLAILLCFIFSLKTEAQAKSIVRFSIVYSFYADTGCRKLVVKTILPQNISQKQQVLEFTAFPTPDSIYQANGCNYANFTLQDIQGEQKIRIGGRALIYEYDVRKNLKKEGVLLKDYKVPDSLYQYVLPERFIESADETIKQCADSLKARTLFGTVKNIYHYVQKNVTYKEFHYSLGARNALLLKTGDCNEFADLFIALCRANGIPARKADGILMTEIGRGYHAWAEVFVDEVGWIALDPTQHQDALDFMSRPHLYFSTIRNNPELNYNSSCMRYNANGSRIKLVDAFKLTVE